MHAHIILWIHPEDKETASRQITAACPCEGWNEESKNFVAPSDPLQHRLYRLVVDKQLHTCRSTACRHNVCPSTVRCKDGFPHAVRTDTVPGLDPNTNRTAYFCPTEAHQMVPPTSMLLLFSWGAHCNVQTIQQVSWSQYLLKYSMKAEPSGVLRADPELAKRLGLDEFPPNVRTVASALWLAHPVPACEAALIMLGIPIVEMSSAVDYVASNPPDSRTNIVRGSGHLCRSAVDKYQGRPHTPEMAETTFYQ